jgi:hypothetical protein
MVTTDSPTVPTPDTSHSTEGEAAVERGRRWSPFVLAAIAVLVGVSLLLPAGRHQWAISIFRQQTRYTTLSFQDAATLPSTVAAGSSVHLSFTVENHEGQRVRYLYVLTSTNVAAADSQTILYRATLTLPDGGRRTVSITARPMCTSSYCRLQVSLPGHPETIDVLLHVHRPTG